MSLVGGGITAKILAKRTKTGSRVRRSLESRCHVLPPSAVCPYVRASVRALPRLALCHVGRSVRRRGRGLLDLALDSRRTKKPIHHFPETRMI